MSYRNKDQGTEWETVNVAKAISLGFDAERLAEGGIKDVCDVIVRHPDYAGIRELREGLVALAYKQYEDGPTPARRKSHRVYVLDSDTFWKMVRLSERPWFIECKARERLNVGEALDKAKAKVATALKRRLEGRK